MFVRPADNYTNGASVQYMGMNDMWSYWIARPNIYKPNILSIDDTVSSSTADVAIRLYKIISQKNLTLGFKYFIFKKRKGIEQSKNAS